jgi:hypothetical protein
MYDTIYTILIKPNASREVQVELMKASYMHEAGHTLFILFSPLIPYLLSLLWNLRAQ